MHTHEENNDEDINKPYEIVRTAQLYHYVKKLRGNHIAGVTEKCITKIMSSGNTYYKCYKKKEYHWGSSVIKDLKREIFISTILYYLSLQILTKKLMAN